MHLSSFGFGILLLLQAALAQSAPRLSIAENPDEEEELIDTLALLARASSRSNAFDQPADFEIGSIPSLDYASPGDGLRYEKPEWADLPRQFAYRPEDPRFYMSPPKFQSDYEQQRVGDPGVRYYKSDIDTIMNDIGQQERIQPQYRPSTLDEATHIFNDNAPERNLRGDEEPGALHYMKKSNRRLAETEEDDVDMSLNANPNANTDRSSNVDVAKSPGVIEKNQLDSSQASNPPSIPSKQNKSQFPYESHLSMQNPNYIMKSSHEADVPGFITLDGTVNSGFPSFYYVAIIAGCSAAAVVGVIAAGICWIHERVKAAADVDYPAYGVTGPSKDVSPSGGDRKLAQSAHMYHYQHQKQQMAALAKSPTQGERTGSGGSDVESEDDNEDGDYTVYECPGLACNTGEIEVKNPLYEDEPTPASPQLVPSEGETDTAQK